MKSDPTSLKRVASIDIGTNTILLLVAEIEEGKLTPLFEKETVVRLGEGVQKNAFLLKEAMERGLETLSQYVSACREYGVQKVFVAGTSALREARNAGTFLKTAKEKLDLTVEVISGEEEAQLSFLAVAEDLHNKEKPILVVDVGGGSTEYIWGKGHQIKQWVSLPLGSVRFTEQFLHSDPIQENEWEKMEVRIREHLTCLPRSEEPFTLVAVGGTATTLASVELGLGEFLIEKLHHFILKKEALEKQVLQYRLKTIEERKKIPGLPASRADVILAGGTILYLTLEELHCPSVLISCHGVRYGLLYKKLGL